MLEKTARARRSRSLWQSLFLTIPGVRGEFTHRSRTVLVSSSPEGLET